MRYDRVIVEIGQRFSMLIVCSQAEKKNGTIMFSCKCDCGKTREVRKDSLVNNYTKSCGCLRKRGNRHTHDLFKQNYKLWRVWAAIKQRCYYKKHIAYNFIGAKGVKVSPEWKNHFNVFYDWCIKEGWQPNYKIRRHDSNGDYSPENCYIYKGKVEQPKKVKVVHCEELGRQFSTGKEASIFFKVHTTSIYNSINMGYKLLGRYTLVRHEYLVNQQVA